MVIERDNTTRVLQEVVHRLLLRGRCKYTISTDSTDGFITMEEEKKVAATIQEHFAKILATISGTKPNELSILFAVTDFILVYYNACAPYVEDQNTPSNFTYESEVRGYQYMDRILEMSIVTENDVKSTSKYQYMCFSFPEGDHIYHIEEIPVKWIPTFATGKEEQDQISIQFLCITIAQIFDSVFRKFTETGKFRSREFSLSGIRPIFSDSVKCSGEQPPKKRKKAIPTSRYDTTKFKPATPVFYKKLCDLFKKMDPKPNASSRIFAMIHEILTSACACKTTIQKDEWPGGLMYNSDVIQVWFPDSEFAQSNVQYHLFNSSLLKNDKEFYFCLRFTNDHTKKCIKKLNESLVPTFHPSDTRKDAERIHNLNVWLSAIIKTFVVKVVIGSYSSQNVSFVSLTSTVSQSEDENESFDEPSTSF